MGTINKALSKEEFEQQVLQSSKPVLVDFWAPWCGPCKSLETVFNKVLDSYPDLSIVKVDVDTNLKMAGAYDVKSVPTCVVFNKGETIDRIVGMVNEKPLREFLDKYFKEDKS